MSHYLAQNIRFLRKKMGLTQGALASRLGINRAALGSYEEGRAEPRLSVLQFMAQCFSCSIDDLLHLDLEQGKPAPVDKKGKSLRVLSVAVDEQEQERIVVVPVKAAAGYLNGFGDVDYIGSLPSFRLPLQELGRERSYRLFQIKGDSMNPVPDGAYIITEYVQDWTQIKDDQCYVLITRDEGIVYKRVLNRPGEDALILKSDNPAYTPYPVAFGTIAEVWKAVGYISLQLPESGSDPLNAGLILNALSRLEDDMKELKERVKN